MASSLSICRRKKMRCCARPRSAQALDIVRLATPTTNDTRLPTVLEGASGFLYYVSIAGVTGTKSFAEDDVRAAVARLKAQERSSRARSGFGIKTPEQAGAIARFADGAVVGSAIVDLVAKNAANGGSRESLVSETLEFCHLLADAVHSARG